MIGIHPLDALVVIRDRSTQLRAEAAGERLRGASTARRALAVSLRRAANHLDPVPLTEQPAPS